MPTPESVEQVRDGAAASFVRHVGARVRLRRRLAELTVGELAIRAGISRRMLTQIEQGQANPSLVTVDKIAQALGVDFVALASGRSTDVVSINPPGAAVEVWTSAKGGSARLHVASTRTGGSELWEWTLAPGDTYRAQPDPPGSEELLLVTVGTLTLAVDGRRIDLPVGASMRLASDRPYAYDNATDREVTFTRVVQLAPIGPPAATPASLVGP